MPTTYYGDDMRTAQIKLTIEIPDLFEGTGEEVIKQLMTHYDDLGHLASELKIKSGTIFADDYYSTNF